MDYDDAWLFWCTLIGVLFGYIIIIKLCWDFWCSMEKDSKVPLYIKIFTLLYPLIMTSRFMFSMSGAVEFDPEISIAGSCFAYLSSLAFYIFMALRLLLIFQDTIYEIKSWQIISSIIICALDVIYGMILTIEREDMASWKPHNQSLAVFFYNAIQFILLCWLIIMFNSRLYSLILNQRSTLHFMYQSNEQSVASASASPSIDDMNVSPPTSPSLSKRVTSFFAENKISNLKQIEVTEEQKVFIRLITRQTLLLCIMLMTRCIITFFTIFWQYEPEIYQENDGKFKWKLSRMIVRSFTFLLIYLSFQFSLSNKLYGACCKYFHKSCYFCCKLIVRKKLKDQYEDTVEFDAFAEKYEGYDTDWDDDFQLDHNQPISTHMQLSVTTASNATS